jgi:hypothetical protein
VTNTLAYYDMKLCTALKSFIVQTQEKKFTEKDKTWVEFSTLEMTAFIPFVSFAC